MIKEEIRKLCSGSDIDRCLIIHSDSTDKAGPGITAAENPEHESILNLYVYGEITQNLYISVPETLVMNGVKRVVLIAEGQVIGPDIKGSMFRIIDHIACHHTNPLSGTGEARTGRAFIDMRDPYCTGADDPVIDELIPEGIQDVILWHSPGINEEEKRIALEAGCRMTSKYHAPWSVGVRRSGMELTAALRIP